MAERKTYGEVLKEHWSKPHTDSDDVIEYRKAMEPEIVRNKHGTVAKALKLDSYRNKDFYVCLLMKTERIGGVPHTFTFARHSCPTPTYQQSVWKYHHRSQDLEFLWSIPEQTLYWYIYRNAPQFLKDPETRGLAQFVCLMESGELLKWVIKENGEKLDGIIKYKEEPVIQ